MGSHADAAQIAAESCHWRVRTLTQYLFRACLLIPLLVGVVAAALADTVNYSHRFPRRLET